MITPYVEITNLRGGDEKRYWFKCPIGERMESAEEKAMKIIIKDITDMGRSPKDYKFLVGDGGKGKTLRAVYKGE